MAKKEPLPDATLTDEVRAAFGSRALVLKNDLGVINGGVINPQIFDGYAFHSATDLPQKIANKVAYKSEHVIDWMLRNTR